MKRAGVKQAGQDSQLAVAAALDGDSQRLVLGDAYLVVVLAGAQRAHAGKVIGQRQWIRSDVAINLHAVLQHVRQRRDGQVVVARPREDAERVAAADGEVDVIVEG